MKTASINTPNTAPQQRRDLSAWWLAAGCALSLGLHLAVAGGTRGLLRGGSGGNSLWGTGAAAGTLSWPAPRAGGQIEITLAPAAATTPSAPSAFPAAAAPITSVSYAAAPAPAPAPPDDVSATVEYQDDPNTPVPAPEDGEIPDAPAAAPALAPLPTIAPAAASQAERERNVGFRPGGWTFSNPAPLAPAPVTPLSVTTPARVAAAPVSAMPGMPVLPGGGLPLPAGAPPRFGQPLVEPTTATAGMPGVQATSAGPPQPGGLVPNASFPAATPSTLPAASTPSVPAGAPGENNDSGGPLAIMPVAPAQPAAVPQTPTQPPKTPAAEPGPAVPSSPMATPNGTPATPGTPAPAPTPTPPDTTPPATSPAAAPAPEKASTPVTREPKTTAAEPPRSRDGETNKTTDKTTETNEANAETAPAVYASVSLVPVRTAAARPAPSEKTNNAEGDAANADQNEKDAQKPEPDKPAGGNDSAAIPTRFRGTYAAPREATYRFRLAAGPGAKLTVDGATVIASSAGRRASGSLHLKAGRHRIEVQRPPATTANTAAAPTLEVTADK